MDGSSYTLPAQIGWVGSGLHRPDCVLATAAGDLHCADWRGGVAHLLADGSESLIWEDVAAEHLDRCEQAYVSGTLGREHLDNAAGFALRNISSLAFGGPDLRTAFLECLLGDRIASFRTQVAGLPPVQWPYH